MSRTPDFECIVLRAPDALAVCRWDADASYWVCRLFIDINIFPALKDGDFPR